MQFPTSRTRNAFSLSTLALVVLPLALSAPASATASGSNRLSNGGFEQISAPQ